MTETITNLRTSANSKLGPEVSSTRAVLELDQLGPAAPVRPPRPPVMTTLPWRNTPLHKRNKYIRA
jgi:hypothetical protein